MRIAKASFFKIVAISLFIFFLGSGVFLYATSTSLPDASQIKRLHVHTGIKVESSDGHIIGFLGHGLSSPVSLDKVPLNLVNAVIAVEDQRYFEHRGVDIKGLMRATVALIKSGKKKQGGSTITMQLARYFYLTRNKTYSRKIKEILLAWKMNRILSKKKILELYLNQMYFGHGAYGVVSAAQIYYGKPLSQLTLAESAMLAAHLQSPAFVNAITSPQIAKKRRDSILLKMKKADKITAAEYNQAVAAALTASPHKALSLSSVDAPYFLAMIRHKLIKTYGADVLKKSYTIRTTLDSRMQEAARKSLMIGILQYARRQGYIGPIKFLGAYRKGNDIVWEKVLRKLPHESLLVPGAVVSVKDKSIVVMLSDGRRVTVAWGGLSWARRRIPLAVTEDKREHSDLAYKLGPKPQKAADVATIGDVIWLQNEHGVWWLSEKSNIQGAIVTLSARSGAVLALVGGSSYQHSQFNRVTQMKRQIGSAGKPFFYSAALDKGFTMATMMDDKPIEIKKNHDGLVWSPKNYDNKYRGKVSLRTAIRRSSNVVAVQLLQSIGLPYAIQYLRRFGFYNIEDSHGLGLVLGTLEESPLNLAKGYAVFANGGYQIFPYFIKSVSDFYHVYLFQQNNPVVCHRAIGTRKLAKRVITESNSFLITKMLSYQYRLIPSPVGKRASGYLDSRNNKNILRRYTAKTGTSSHYRDVWYAGYNSKLVTVVWLGFDRGQSVGEPASVCAKPIWLRYMRSIASLYKQSLRSKPHDIVTVSINPKTGKWAPPKSAGVINEYFRKQYAPTPNDVKAPV